MRLRTALASGDGGLCWWQWRQQALISLPSPLPPAHLPFPRPRPLQLLALLLSGFVNQMWSIFAGFMVPYPSMPAAWQWMNRISPSTWTLWGLVESQLGDNDIPMTGFGGQPTTISAFMTDAFGYTYGMIWWCVLILFGFCAFFRGECLPVGGRCGLGGWVCGGWMGGECRWSAWPCCAVLWLTHVWPHIWLACTKCMQ